MQVETDGEIGGEGVIRLSSSSAPCFSQLTASLLACLTHQRLLAKIRRRKRLLAVYIKEGWLELSVLPSLTLVRTSQWLAGKLHKHTL